MAKPTFFSQLRPLFRIQTRTPKISLNRATILANQKIIRGVLALSIAILIGSWSHELSAQYARNDWENSNPPPEAFWDHELAAIGFSPVLNEKAFVGLTRGLISTEERAFGVVLNKALGCVALFGLASESFPTRLYCRPFSAALVRENHGSAWENLGYGWEGYRTAFNLLKKMTPLVIEQRRFANRRADPREIQY